MLKDAETRTLLENAFLGAGDKTVTVIKGIYPSDQKNFKRGVGICALKHSKIWGYYMDRIHTAKDTVLDVNNVSFLRDRLIGLIGSAAE